MKQTPQIIKVRRALLGESRSRIQMQQACVFYAGPLVNWRNSCFKDNPIAVP